MKKITSKDSLFKILESKYNSFSNKKKVVARYILSNYEEIAFSSADEVALKLNIATSTVIRFINELGFESYLDFKSLLKENILLKIKNLGPFEKAKKFSRNKHNIFENSIIQDLVNIKTLLKNIQPEKLDKFVKTILSSKNKVIVANRASYSIGHFLYYQLRKLMNKTYLLSDYDNGIYDVLEELTEDDVVICISFPRYSNLSLKIFNYLKHRKLNTLAITDNGISPLNNIADICLFCPYEGYSFSISQAASMALINAILNEIFIEKKDEAIAKLEQEEKTLTEFNIVYLKNNIIDFKLNDK